MSKWEEINMSYEKPVGNEGWIRPCKKNCDRAFCDRTNRCICDLKECICCGTK